MLASTPAKLAPKQSNLCPSLRPVRDRQMVFCSHFPALAIFITGHYCCETFPSARAPLLPRMAAFWLPRSSEQMLIQGEATNAGGTAGTAASLTGAQGQSGLSGGFLSHSSIPGIAATVTIVPWFLTVLQPSVVWVPVWAQRQTEIEKQRAKENGNNGPWIQAARRECEERGCYHLQIGENMHVPASWTLLSVLQD